jgi:hypothetical protein
MAASGSGTNEEPGRDVRHKIALFCSILEIKLELECFPPPAPLDQRTGFSEEPENLPAP